MGYGTSTATCGPEAWSTDTMSYATLPSCGGVTGAALDRDVGFTGPVASPTSADATSSTSMLHQEMKELETAAPPPRAVLAAAATVCGSSSAGGARHSSGASCHWTARFQPAHERARCARST
jgi:hypothetical protein